MRKIILAVFIFIISNVAYADSDIVSVKDRGALGDLVQRSDGTVGGGSAIFEFPGEFTSADIGKIIWIEGAEETGNAIENITDENGEILITSTLRMVEPYQTICIKDVLGTVEANGCWEAERIDNDKLILKGSTFVNAYTSGGTFHRRWEGTIIGISGDDAILSSNVGTTISGNAKWGYGTDDTAAFQAAADTGKAVIVPPGQYLVSQMLITADGQKLIGMGGCINALPRSFHDLSNEGMIQIEADFVEVTGICADNPTWQNEKAPSWPDAIRSGIEVRGHRANIHHNTIKQFLHGISVAASPGYGSGLEHEGTIIDSNIVWDNLGAGAGTDQAVDGNQGESSGDAIACWGAHCSIRGNTVKCKLGHDCRIGIHVEALDDRYDPLAPGALYPDSGAIISGNFVIGHDMRFRNGRFRRAIVTEGVQNATITSNSIYGGGWWAIAVIMGPTDHPPMIEEFHGKGNVSIANNAIWWTRPESDTAGLNWSPPKGAITIMSNTSDASKGIYNVSIVGNTIDIFGAADHGIRVYNNKAGGRHGTISIASNAIRNEHGRLGRCIITFPGMDELSVVGNTCRGKLDRDGFRFQNGAELLTVSANVIHITNMDETNDGHGIFSSSTETHALAITGNLIQGPRRDGIAIYNAGETVISSNILRDIGGDGINGYGIDSGIAALNIFVNIGGDYFKYWTPGPNKIEDNNIKN